ncbi:MAG: TrkA family potassium uptake protein [Propionibacteriaceae bacterium]|nr:TrkA family potassium uptake protein [Propionibacteriaceae bacterium]
MGCGRVGSRLALSLEKRGHSVAVIDVDVDAFRRLGPNFAGRTVKGVGFDREVLELAGVREADGFAAVSSGDNSNILAARVVREFFDIENVVARIYDPDRAAVYERLGIPTVATVRWAADKVLRRLLPEGSEPVWRDRSGSALLVEVHVHPGWVGQTIERMQEAARTPIPFLLRVGAGIVARPETIFQEGDLAYAACETGRVSDVETVLGAPPRKH